MAGYQPKYPVTDPAVQDNFEDIYARLYRRDTFTPATACISGFTQAGSNAALTFFVGAADNGVQAPMLCTLDEITVSCVHTPASAKTVTARNVDTGRERAFAVTTAFTRYDPDSENLPPLDLGRGEKFALSISRQTTNTGYNVQCIFRERLLTTNEVMESE